MPAGDCIVHLTKQNYETKTTGSMSLRSSVSIAMGKHKNHEDSVKSFFFRTLEALNL